jgi:hypothetical protein
MLNLDDERASREAFGLWWRLFGKLSVIETVEPLDARDARVLRYLRERGIRAGRAKAQARRARFN